MRLDGKKVVILLAASSVPALFFCGCRTEVMAAREELAPATRDYISEYAGKEEDLAALNQRRAEAGKPPYGTSASAQKKAPAAKSAVADFEPMAPIDPSELPKNTYKTSAAVPPGGTYTVVAGDSLSRIARKNHTTVAKLAAANNLRSDAKIYVGQKLVIPGASGTVPAAARAKTGTARRTASAPAAVTGGLYTVKPGDSIDRIARRTGVRRSELMKANQLTASSVLRVGQKLVIPGASGAAPASAASGVSAGKAAAPSQAADKTPAAAGKDNPDDTLNSLIKDLGGTEEKGASPAPKAAAPANDALSTMEVMHDVKAADFAAQFDYSLEQLKEANKGNWPADGVFKAGTLIRLPQ